MNGLNRENILKWLRIIGIIIGAITGTTVANRTGCGMVPPPAPSATSPAPAPAPAPVEPPATDKTACIIKIQFGNAGCSGTLIMPPLEDGRVLILTASHCLQGQPSAGVAITRDGRRFGVHVVSHDPASDHGWLVSDAPQAGLKFAYLTENDPKVGDPVYHCGFGSDKPGNLESGIVVNPSVNDTKVEFRISVSHGDSGGGIALDKNGHVISPVCCTTSVGSVGRVFGCKPSIARATRPSTKVSNVEWTPIPIPLIEAPQPMPPN